MGAVPCIHVCFFIAQTCVCTVLSMCLVVQCTAAHNVPSLLVPQV